MPARRSDARKSDASVARFALADDDSSAAQEPATEAPVPATTAAPPPPSAPASPQGERKEKEKEKEKDLITIEDLTLPKSIITRLAKGVLPPNTQIQQNAILALSKSATVFINHLASSANEFTLSANKKTIMPPDVFKALDEIEYGFMRERLEAEFAKFNQVQTSKRSTYRKKVAAAKRASTAGGDASILSTALQDLDAGMPQDDGAAAGQSRAAKKARIDLSRGAGDNSRMEVDEHEPSDAETIPDEAEEEEEDEDEEDEEDEEEDEDEPEGGDEDREDEDERTGLDEDEALDDEDSE